MIVTSFPSHGELPDGSGDSPTGGKRRVLGVRPLNISALHELQERNYRLLEQLICDLDLPVDAAVSHSCKDLPLHLEISDRANYTLALRLYYEIEGRREPEIWITMYRDAQLAEATYFERRPRWLAWDEGHPDVYRYLSAQWDRNLTLHKWLLYLLERGHGFGMVARPRKRRAAKA